MWLGIFFVVLRAKLWFLCANIQDLWTKACTIGFIIDFSLPLINQGDMLRRGHVCDGKINIILQSFTYPPWYSKDKKTWPDWKYVSNLAENELCRAAMRNIITAVTLQIKVTAKNILWRKMLALSKCMPAFYRWRHWIEILTQVSWYPWVHYCVSTFHPCLPVIEWCKLKKLTFSIGRQKMPKKHTKTALAAKILDRFPQNLGCRSTYMCYRLLSTTVVFRLFTSNIFADF